MNIPEPFLDYGCGDYFASDEFTHGIWSESEQLYLIIPANEVVERIDLKFLVVGRPGVDGIEFGYRRGHEGVWAYYPIAREFAQVAPSLSALVEGWLSGNIKV